ncbi:DUF6046 domain-containing protein (plasmid) [Leptospira weilii]|uniref:DUF6046 domain-containing protein n=1 Tax=Leptospira weilii TaxID=28184 RepID=UPI00201B6CD8|nr:DUF6046 domain-containing protein [Leptospira weilii]UPY79878.1 DUF6046 domain-containing protein [Leptospira weilii]UPY80389.1 DUF6046 domain-containing protein [Leptospira weilii]UPY81026.1 DUF6046 domain-containing protein [Leptospira weilii]
MIGGITPPIAPAGYIPPEIITGDTDRLVISPGILSDFEFPSGTKITLRKEKRIILTAIPGGSGTVKELTGQDDWTITIEFSLLAAVYGAGFLAAPSNPLIKTMIQQIKEIKRIWENTDSIGLTHSLLNALGINNVVCKSIQLSNAIIQYSQPITFVFLSDNDIDLDRASLEAKSSIVESSL